MGYGIIIAIVALQLAIAWGVAAMLSRSLDRSLMEAGFEQLAGLSRDHLSALDEKQITLVVAKPLLPRVAERLDSLNRSKLKDIDVDILDRPDIKGGLIIIVGDDVYDFSVLSRLKHLFGKESS